MPTNNPERIYAIFLMILGVVTFSCIAGTVSNVITSYDNGDTILKEKIAILNGITQRYSIDTQLFGKLLRVLRYDSSKNDRTTKQFMEELPLKLKQELTIQMHISAYKNVKFFKGRELAFIAWIAPLITELQIESGDYFYKEGAETVEGNLNFIQYSS